MVFEHDRKNAEIILMPAYIRIFQCSEYCDMASGPCACGAWHSLSCWRDTYEKNRNGLTFTKQRRAVKQIIEYLEEYFK